ncbi:N-hydroxyarylamine O-acetyltransferase [Novosphingobium chloroacetimidivorans]|uniref:N-hydroxyarylamine O-acetyltransferase n=1 Tax=Novosphingobium chloroacetimidivorans TaxID=1428314 RepID=A0A7W7K7L8_9SPHN|nr:arylamine N-acetyltransferase [Novosphingobium chloroacetimidivorans]MBB4857073.1 N-hydroxyarylamine O-acetyltransferase [Novosphingobium chloroacetimidivorans]
MDLCRYLTRIGLDHTPPATAQGVAQLQGAHRLAIGFENLDVMLGRRIAIDSGSVFDKLVGRCRGGYCFEHNRLFADVLAVLGVANRPLLARVRLMVPPDVVPPRTHVCLLATIEGEPWLADAGFGGSNLPPLPLADSAEQALPDGSRHRLVHLGPCGSLTGEWRLERCAAACPGLDAPWQAQYTFDLSEVAPDDLEQANHWTSTRAGTRFTSLHVASIPLPDGFASMTDRELTLHRGGTVERRTIEDAADYAATLRRVFRIELSDGDAMRLPLFA